MRIRGLLALLVIAGLVVLAVLFVPEMRLRAGLENAGIAKPVAKCMAQRMVKRLSYAQLWKMADMPAARGSGSRKAFLHNVRALGDAEIVAVTISSFTICEVGHLL